MDLLFLILILLQKLITADRECPSGCTCEQSHAERISLSCTADRECPSGCTCEQSHAERISLSCTRGQLTTVPQNIDFTVSSWNLSYNKITNIDGKVTTLPSEITILDISHNYIEKLEELPVTITVLNASHNQLSTLPVGLPRALKVVKLSYNQITELHTSHVCNLPHLRTLFLNNNNINKVINSLEVEKCNVEYLILSNNNLEYISVETFSMFNMLRSLDLSSNHIKFVEMGTFSGFSTLKYLSLSQNLLKSLPQNLPIMEWFDISNNKIAKISEDQKSDIYPQDVFLIGQNPFLCDCDLLWLKELYDTKKYQLKFLDVNISLFNPQCNTPDWLSGNGWDVLTNDVFQCTMTSSSSTNEKEEKFHLKDLDAAINRTGESSVTVEWKWNNVKTESGSDVVLIKVHPFGQKHNRKYYSVNIARGKYTIKSLIPETPYIVCTLVINGQPTLADISKFEGSCLEVTTTNTKSMVSSWMKTVFSYAVILLVCTVSLIIGHRSVTLIIHTVYKNKCD